MNATPAAIEIPSRNGAELAKNYLAVWNEPDAETRRRMIAALWAENGRHILQPPQEIRDIAAQPGIAMSATLMAQGHQEIEARATSVHEHWVGSKGFTFRGRDDTDRLGDVVKLHWDAIGEDGSVLGGGLCFLVLTADGRIDRDYTFVVA